MKRAALLGWTILISACSSTPEAAEPAAKEPTARSSAEPAASASAEPVSTPTATASASAPVAASAPKSVYLVGGQSLSDVDFATLQAEMKKAGYELPGPSAANVCGGLEIIQLGIVKKGKPVGVVAIHRPAAKPTTDCKPTSIKESLAAWQKGIDDPKGTTAVVLDEAAGVLLMVNLMAENKAAAKKLLESLAKKP